MALNLIKIYDICREKNTEKNKLQDCGLIPMDFNCPQCSEFMKLKHMVRDGWTWTCDNKVTQRNQTPKRCRKKVSLRKGTFMGQSHLSTFQILGFAHLWSEGLQLRQIKRQLEIGSDNTLVDWSSFCREVS